jgi:hemolysin activation/secretion protein
VQSLQARLQLLQQSDLIERVNAELSPGLRPGEGVLRVLVEEAIPYQVELSLSNHESPSVGATRAELAAWHRNLSGRGDSLSARLGGTEGLRDAELVYELPLTPRDTTLMLRYEMSDAEVIEKPFNLLDIESEFRGLGVGVRHPVVRTPAEELWLGATFERRRTETSLLGQPFSFTAGVDEGRSDVAVLRLTQDWLRRSPSQVVAARSTLSLGLSILGATDIGVEPDGQFLAWLGQFQWARRLGEGGGEVLVRAAAQLSDDPLLPLEQFELGGAESVRGYRENQLVRDNGWVVSAELRLPLLPGPLAGQRLRVGPFVDFGRAWSRERPTPRPGDLGSAGAGLRWDPSRRVHVEAYVARPFREIDNPGHDLQDVGVHFFASYALF